MSEKEVKITYETLFDILRREKNNEELKQLPDGFYDDTKDYLQDKFSILEESKKKQDSFSIVDQEKTAEDLLSIRKVLKELYNRREKKIIKVALDTAMINAPIGNTDNMLDYELELFNRSIKLFRQFRVKVLNNLLEGQALAHLNNNALKEEARLPEFQEGQYLQEEDSSINTQENNDVPEEPKIQDELPEQEQKEINTLKIIFLHDIPQFVGRELEIYGPFKKDEENILPKEIANILIDKGRAKILE